MKQVLTLREREDAVQRTSGALP